MTEPNKPPDKGHKRAPESPRLRETVSFYEKVWSGGDSKTPAGVDAAAVVHLDVDQLERRLEEERTRHRREESEVERVKLRRTSSPRHERHVAADGSVQVGEMSLWWRKGSVILAH